MDIRKITALILAVAMFSVAQAQKEKPTVSVDVTGVSAQVGASTRSFNHWMGDMKSVLRNKTLREISIPATHDSATYDIDQLSLVIDENFFIRVGRVFATGISKTQTKSIEEQLKAGIRGFDLRAYLKKARVIIGRMGVTTQFTLF